MISVKEVRKAIYAKLNVSAVTSLLGSGSASIYHDVAPADAAYPFVVFNEVSEAAEALSFGGHQQQPFLWQVKAIDRNTSASRAEDIDAACVGVLHFQPLTVQGGQHLYSAKESGQSYPETNGEEQYRHCLSVYRIKVQSPL